LRNSTRFHLFKLNRVEMILMAKGWPQLRSFIFQNLFHSHHNETIVEFSDICQSLRVFVVDNWQWTDVPPVL